MNPTMKRALIRLRDRYEVIDLLGGGAFGETFLAKDYGIPGENKPIRVIKRLKQSDNANAIRLFKQEAEVLYRLGKNIDRIPELIEYFEDESEQYFCIVQEYIEGEVLASEFEFGIQWTEERVVSLLLDLLQVLASVHEYNVIHRDIKPTNIIRRFSDGKLVLIDFGAVKEVTQNTDPSTIMIGTKGYMPNEQMTGKPTLASDVYAVGIIGIRALTGLTADRLPINPMTNEFEWLHLAKVSKGLEEILTCMTRYSFTKRYRSAIETLEVLQKFVQSDDPKVSHEPNMSTVANNPNTVILNSQKQNIKTNLGMPVNLDTPQPRPTQTPIIHDKTTELLEVNKSQPNNFLWKFVIAFMLAISVFTIGGFILIKDKENSPNEPASRPAF